MSPNIPFLINLFGDELRINNEVKKIDEKRSIVYSKNKKINSDIILLCVGSRSELIRKLIGQRIVYNNF